MRAAYNAAKYKERACTADFRSALMQAEANYFNAMVGSVTNAQTARDHHRFILGEITEAARHGDLETIRTTIADEGDLRDPLLDRYSENPYINAVVAANAAYAKHCGIRLESNVELGAARLKTIEFCVILNDALVYAIDRAGAADTDDKLVRMTVTPLEGRITFEAVYPRRRRKEAPGAERAVLQCVGRLTARAEGRRGCAAARGRPRHHRAHKRHDEPQRRRRLGDPAHRCQQLSAFRLKIYFERKRSPMKSEPLYSEVAAAYDFGSEVLSIAPYGNGHINDTYLVLCAGGEYVLQRINKFVFPRPDKLMENMLGVTRFVAGKLKGAGRRPRPRHADRAQNGGRRRLVYRQRRALLARNAEHSGHHGL